ncbi:acyltransferase family protein [Roseateles sp. DC23W]|uniref:Acyltransferase family protein n=1 Tax=Pelomonas dachongensis TaxID=3299029 RepID=A0ABW7ET36_9BURK
MPAAKWLRSQLELGRVTGSTTLRPMEGLRGVAVLLVFLVHYATLVTPWVPRGGLSSQVLDVVHAVGNVGVDLFFVLSGYLIYSSLLESPKPFAVYLRRRVQRIYPTFLAVFALYLGLTLFLQRPERFPAEPAAAALYVLQNLLLLPGVFPIDALIAVAWSLSYEFFFYLLVPLVVGLGRLRARTREWRIGFLLLATAVVLVGFGTWGGPVRMTMFLAGMLLHELLRGGRGTSMSSSAGLLAGLLGLAVPLVAMPGPTLQAVRVGLVYLGFLGLCLASFGHPDGALARWLAWTPLRWMGNISYSYYLLHGLALQVFFTLLARLLPTGGEWAAPALLLPAWLATLPPCLALFLCIERPMSLASGTGRPATATVRLEA